MSELEVLTGKIARGDITPLVYELLKDSKNKGDILTYKNLINNKLAKKLEDDIKPEDKDLTALSFDVWLRGFM